MKQGCIHPLFLLILAVDWLITEITKADAGNKSIRWTRTSNPEDLDCAGGIGLLQENQGLCVCVCVLLRITKTCNVYKVLSCKQRFIQTKDMLKKWCDLI